MTTINLLDQSIKNTTSLCPICRRQIDAQVVARDGKVYLDKRCPEHGPFSVMINSDRRFYYESTGSPGTPGTPGTAEGCGPGCGCGHDPLLVEQSSTCIALIEIVTSCNLACPTCYADSPVGMDAVSMDDFRRRIDAVTQRKGKIDILQLSGGEPTIHPQFFDLFEWALTSDDIGYVLLNTNGVRLVRDAAFMGRLGELCRQHRGFELYLQFDGTQAAGQEQLRGADLRSLREQVIDACAAHGIAVTLAMTVTDENLPHLGDALRFGLSRRAVRGISFQPMFGSGRTPTQTFDRLNVADVILGLIEQSGGLLTERDFTPLPCGDPNCHTIGYLIRRGETIERVSDLIDFGNLQGFLRDRLNFDMADLQQCGCESEPLGHVLKALEIGPDDVFRLFIKPFMDAWTYDQHRIDRCCVHVIGEGGKLESFCRHYAMKG